MKTTIQPIVQTSKCKDCKFFRGADVLECNPLNEFTSIQKKRNREEENKEGKCEYFQVANLLQKFLNS